MTKENLLVDVLTYRCKVSTLGLTHGLENHLTPKENSSFIYIPPQYIYVNITRPSGKRGHREGLWKFLFIYRLCFSNDVCNPVLSTTISQDRIYIFMYKSSLLKFVCKFSSILPLRK